MRNKSHINVQYNNQSWSKTPHNHYCLPPTTLASMTELLYTAFWCDFVNYFYLTCNFHPSMSLSPQYNHQMYILSRIHPPPRPNQFSILWEMEEKISFLFSVEFCSSDNLTIMRKLQTWFQFLKKLNFFSTGDCSTLRRLCFVSNAYPRVN